MTEVPKEPTTLTEGNPDLPSTTGTRALQETYITLRNRKIYKAAEEKQFSEYLQNLYGSDLNLDNLKELEKRLTKTSRHSENLIQNYKSATLNFRHSIENYKSGTVRSVSDSDLNISGDWLAGNKSDSDFKVQLSSVTNPNESFPHTRTENSTDHLTMTDYEKVIKLTTQMVPIFSGEATPKRGEDLQAFLVCCRQVLKCLNDAEKEAFLEIVLTRVRGDAYQLLCASSIKKFTEIESILNRAYLPRKNYQELINELLASRQVPYESISSYTSRIKYIMTLCKECAEEKYKTTAPAVKQQIEDLAIAVLKNGVNNPYLSQFLLTLSDSSLESLAIKALDMEKLQQGSLWAQFGANPTLKSFNPTNEQYNVNQNNFPPYNYPNVSEYENINKFARNTASLQSQIFDQAGSNTIPRSAALSVSQNLDIPPRNSYDNARKQYTNTSRTNIVCNFCHKRGHTYSDCLKRKNTPYCTNCRVYNHDVRDCRRRNWERTNPQQGRQSAVGVGNNQQQKIHTMVQETCNFCGRKNHSEEDCRMKERWMLRNSGNGQQSSENSPVRL